jgi:hypothetical protein
MPHSLEATYVQSIRMHGEPLRKLGSLRKQIVVAGETGFPRMCE